MKSLLSKRMAANTCKFHQYGHCKFGSSCRNIHTLETCTNHLCDKLTCSLRHPKPCKYHTQSLNCIFGASCSYFHVNKVNEDNIETLKNDLKYVLALLTEKEKEIKTLAEKVTKLEGQFEVFTCDNCNSNSKVSVFTTHVNTTHEAANVPIPLPSSLPITASLPSSLSSSPSPPPFPLPVPPPLYSLLAPAPACAPGVASPPRGILAPVGRGASCSLHLLLKPWGPVTILQIWLLPHHCQKTGTRITVMKQMFPVITVGLLSHLSMCSTTTHTPSLGLAPTVVAPRGATKEVLLDSKFCVFCSFNPQCIPNLCVTPNLEDHMWSLFGFNKVKWSMYLRIY